LAAVLISVLAALPMNTEVGMRTNKYGVRGLKGVWLKKGLMYFWTPPVSLQKLGIFKHKTLAPDYETAVEKARDWNFRLEAYRVAVKGIKPTLGTIKPMSVGYLVREFAASPRFALYAPRTREDYLYMYRSVEAHLVDGTRMFGDINFKKVTRQLAYSIYEQNVIDHGHSSANKTMGAWQVAFRYGMLRFPGIIVNPFSELDKISSGPRRQRWADQQLVSFIKKANTLGYSSVGLCALICMELMQRPGDVLSLRWSAYDESEKVWHIRQSKRGTTVRVPETRRLSAALNAARSSLKVRHGREINEKFVCATKTGKRWHRRNFTKAARRVARAAGLPDDLQIRDLRRTAATEGASAGATPAEMMAVGGWVSQASIRPYLVQTQEQAAAFQGKRDLYRQKHSNKSSLPTR